MKAAYIVSARTFEIRDVPVPTVAPDGLLVAVKACGVCGSDLRRWREGPAAGTQPVIAGHEISCVVTEAGAEVKDIAVGDRLAIAPDIHCGKCYYCKRGLYNLCNQLKLIGITPGYDGGFAEYMQVTAQMMRDGAVHPMPAALSFVDGALAEPLSSVLASHEDAGTTIGHTVVVMGGGPIGCLHLAVAQGRGARVILSEPSEVRREIARRFHPALIVDPLSQDLNAEVRALTDGRGADTVICANGIAATHLQAVQIARKRGRVVLFGGLPKSDPITCLDGNRIHYDEITVTGAFSYHPRYHELALNVIESGLVACEDVVTHTFPIDRIEDAFEAAANAASLKVMVEM